MIFTKETEIDLVVAGEKQMWNEDLWYHEAGNLCPDGHVLPTVTGHPQLSWIPDKGQSALADGVSSSLSDSNFAKVCGMKPINHG